jgi:hypothetical protein
MERSLLTLLGLALLGAAAGCGSHGGDIAKNAFAALSPSAQQRLLAQLDRRTSAQVNHATHGRIDPRKYFRQEFCTPKSDSQVVCSVKGVGKYRFEWRWLVTVDRRSDSFRMRVISKRLPRRHT